MNYDMAHFVRVMVCEGFEGAECVRGCGRLRGASDPCFIRNQWLPFATRTFV
jgi:hypothetical protein